MKQIESIIEKFTLNRHYLYKSDRKKLSELIEQYISDNYVNKIVYKIPESEIKKGLK